MFLIKLNKAVTQMLPYLEFFLSEKKQCFVLKTRHLDFRVLTNLQTSNSLTPLDITAHPKLHFPLFF